MAIVKKVTIGVQPLVKMFRVRSLGGVAADAVLGLRSRVIEDNYFDEVAYGHEKQTYHLSSESKGNFLHLTEESIVLIKDFYGDGKKYSWEDVFEEFRTIWNALNKTLNVSGIRRLGVVAEMRYEVDGQTPSDWLRSRLIALPTSRISDKVSVRYEERERPSDGSIIDPKKSDFINYIYHWYDGSLDSSHPDGKTLNANVDVQRYFAPVSNDAVPDELVKLRKYFEQAYKGLDQQAKSFGARNVGR